MTEEAHGSPRQAFEHATLLLQRGDVASAKAQLEAILEVDPNEVNALRLLGDIEWKAGETERGLARLEKAVSIAPSFDHATLTLANAYRAGSRLDDARRTLEAFIQKKPDSLLIWQLLGDVLFEAGATDEARSAQQRAIDVDPFRNRIREAIGYSRAGRGREAETRYRDILKQFPDHIHALVGLANIAIDRGVLDDAGRLLDHALNVSPNLSHIHRALARLHMSQSHFELAMSAAERAVSLNPELSDSWTTKGTVEAWGLKQADAATSFVKALEIERRQPRVWLSLGHVNKALGRRDESIAAYRQAIALDPGLGEAWWSLADLKTYTFPETEIQQMKATLDGDLNNPRDRAAVHFALGKAYEDAADAASSFEHYVEGNAIRHQHEQFNISRFEQQCRRLKDVFSSQTITRLRTDHDHEPVPIFVVGLPRSGSTLVDQILSSHSQVQGTMELPHVLGYVRELSGVSQEDERGKYPGCIEHMAPSDLAALGERYLHETREYHEGRPYFVDKMPNNFMHVGLIHCMLPRAIFIDTRRHPLACCFSIFKQNFARGQTFSYSLEALAAYYRNYVDVMAHWDSVVPGRVHRVIYERMVDDSEAEMRRLIAHCGLDFEPGCLRFFENPRVVRTASADQVRRPIYGSARDHWQQFEPFLGPLTAGLGPVLENWGE